MSFNKNKLKKRKSAFKIGTGFMLFILFLIGIGLSSPLTKKQDLATSQQKASSPYSKNTNEQNRLDKENALDTPNNELKQTKPEIADTPNTKETNNTKSASVTGQLKVHFIDVGQADSILIQQGSSNMLIDAGNNEDSQTIKNYLDNQGIKSLDVIIGTHAHEDHIGSMDYIVNSFRIGKVYFPKQTTTTKTFQDFILSVKTKGLQLNTPTVGSSFRLGDATAEILAPNGTGYEDPNDYSIVVKITFGNTSFLLTGDAEAVSESQMLSKGLDLSSTVLKVGHHGSKSSTTQGFLNKVNPKYAVISVGNDNSYGHPTQDVMNRLKTKNIPVYRTDENGTIVAISNGNNISFNTNPGSYNGISSETSLNNENTNTTAPAIPNLNEKQYVDTNGNGLIKGNASSKIYHLPGGAYYDRTKAEVWFKNESEAQAAGYRRSSR